jgi:glycosyltransferase involved in cell wall biosynthesis
MKILLVVHDFWPKYKAGTENATFFLARELTKKHDVTVFTTEPNSEQVGLHEKYVEEGFNVIKIHVNKGFSRNLRDTYIDEGLDQIFSGYVSEINPDIVHFQHLIGLSLNFIDIVKEKKIPIFYTVHDFWFSCPRIRKYYNEANCLVDSEKRCNQCISSNFLFIDSKNNDLVNDGISILLKKRYVKRMAHILLNDLNLKYILNRRKTTNFIAERKKDFIDHYSRVDLFITPSNFLSGVFIDFGISKKKVLTLSHGINIPEKLENKKRVYTEDNIINFYFISHITADKGFFLLFDNFEKALSKYSNIRLYIYGSYDKNNKKVVDVLKKIENNKFIEYMGVFENEKISEILAGADVVIIPSLWNEIYGLVIDEAYLHGKSVIVSNRGGMPGRVTDERNGFVFDPNKKYDLYEKIKIIAKDPKKLNMLNNNPPKIKSIKEYAEKIEELYRIYTK